MLGILVLKNLMFLGCVTELMQKSFRLGKPVYSNSYTSRYTRAFVLWGTHVCDDPIQPLQRTSQTNFYPAGTARYSLAATT